MLVEDTSALIEQLEVAEADRRVAKRRRRVIQARLKVLEVEWEVGLAAEAVENMERALAEIDLATGSIARGLLRDRRARSLEREIAVTRRRLEGKRAELDVKRQRLLRLEQRAEQLDASRRPAKLFRLYSSQHPECSELRRLRHERASASRSLESSARRGRIGRGFEHRAALRAVQGTPRRERSASEGRASAGRGGFVLRLHVRGCRH